MKEILKNINLNVGCKIREIFRYEKVRVNF